MDERAHALRELAEETAARPDILDAWVAKSFTDLLLVVEVAGGESLPADLVEDLTDRGFVGYNELHDVSAPDAATAGTVSDRDRYRLVDQESRGSQQSSVVE